MCFFDGTFVLWCNAYSWNIQCMWLGCYIMRWHTNEYATFETYVKHKMP